MLSDDSAGFDVYRSKKLKRVEDDDDVRMMINQLIKMNEKISTLSIQSEVIAQFGNNYPAMSPNDWRHIIEPYVRLVRDYEIRTPDGKIFEVFPTGDLMASEPLEDPKED